VGESDMPEHSTSLMVTPARQADDLASVLHQATRAMFGATALFTEVVLRTLGESAAARSGERREGSVDAREAVDVVLGLGWGLAHAADRLVRLGNEIASPVLSLALAPPLVPQKWTAGRLLQRVSLGWRAQRPDAVWSLYAWSAKVAPAASDLVLDLVDVDRLLAQALGRIDPQLLARAVLAQLDIEELMTTALTGLDMRRLVEQGLAELDLTPIVEDVVQRLDLKEIVGTALDQMDLTDIVVEHVDLHRVIMSVLEELDLTQLVLERVDLVRVADVIVEGVDLPEIIRDSTGSMVSETVHDVRVQGIEADRAVSRLVDRLLRRRGEQL
jgi:hypothetical protein